MIVAGSLLILFGLGLGVGGAAVGFLNSRQASGEFLSLPQELYQVDSNAMTTEPISVDENMGSGKAVGTINVRGEAAAPDQELFIGIGPTADVNRYLADVAHSELQDVTFEPFNAYFREFAGTAVPAPPVEQDFWATATSGSGQQEMSWDLDQGRWTVVVMNADGSAPVRAELQMGARSDLLGPVAAAMFVGAACLFLAGAALIVGGVLLRSRTPGPGGYGGTGSPDGPGGPGAYAAAAGYPSATTYPSAADQQGSAPQSGQTSGAPQYPPPPGAAYQPGPPVAPGQGQGQGQGGGNDGAYPARLQGWLDPGLSRWQWLVKWFLAIPHYVVLFFLWIAFAVVTVIAFFAILFTARYPRPLFDFSVGVIRWSWRVSFYAANPLGTDRYPPFTLDRTDYPADFDVDYPERLSRGLVLVKWWLLVIPQALIVGAFTTGTIVVVRTWTGGGYPAGMEGTDYWGMNGVWRVTESGLSLLSLLVLIAVIGLLFTGRYIGSLFALVMGLNRWQYRVLAYTALLRDEYPPFRLDQGPVDPRDTVRMPVQGPDQTPGQGTGQGPGPETGQDQPRDHGTDQEAGQPPGQGPGAQGYPSP